MSVRISVALASFNGERFIAEQLDSILRQSIPVDEIVVADDGSRDTTLAIVRAVLESFRGTVRILEPEANPLGVTRNFERAVRACTGDVIALADQDDVWHVNKLETMVAALDGADLACSDARLVDADGTELPTPARLLVGLGVSPWEHQRIAEGDAWAVLMRRNIVTGATVVFRRDLLRAAGAFPPAWVHDEWLAVVAAAHGGVRLVPTVTIDYRQHGANQIGVRQRFTIADRIARLREPRVARNRRLLQRAEALAAAAEGWEAPAARDAAEKLQHEQQRSALPALRLARLLPVARELATGRYQRFGLGLQDVARDLLQPAR